MKNPIFAYNNSSVSVQRKPIEERKSVLIAQIADQFDFLLVNQVYWSVECDVLEMTFGLVYLQNGEEIR